MLAQVKFWFSPSTETTVWFGVAAVAIVGFLFLVRFLYIRNNKKRHEKELVRKLTDIDLFDRPEEMVVREMAQRYEVVPPAKILSQLQFYDQIAVEEITRIEKSSMPLPDRIDRIEYLYSIRLHAFSREPAVGGLDILLGKEEEPAPVHAGGPPPEDEPLRIEEEAPETLVDVSASSETSEESPEAVQEGEAQEEEEQQGEVQEVEEAGDEEDDVDFAKLLADPSLLGDDSEQEESTASEETPPE